MKSWKPWQNPRPYRRHHVLPVTLWRSASPIHEAVWDFKGSPHCHKGLVILVCGPRRANSHKNRLKFYPRTTQMEDLTKLQTWLQFSTTFSLSLSFFFFTFSEKKSVSHEHLKLRRDTQQSRINALSCSLGLDKNIHLGLEIIFWLFFLF